MENLAKFIVTHQTACLCLLFLFNFCHTQFFLRHKNPFEFVSSIYEKQFLVFLKTYAYVQSNSFKK